MNGVDLRSRSQGHEKAGTRAIIPLQNDMKLRKHSQGLICEGNYYQKTKTKNPTKPNIQPVSIRNMERLNFYFDYFILFSSSVFRGVGGIGDLFVLCVCGVAGWGWGGGGDEGVGECVQRRVSYVIGRYVAWHGSSIR